MAALARTRRAAAVGPPHGQGAVGEDDVELALHAQSRKARDHVTAGAPAHDRVTALENAGVAERLQLTRLRLDGARFHSAPWGLQGGLAGGKGRFVFGPGVERFALGNGTLRAGQWVEIITPGGGGYGPPAGRDRATVTRDIREGRIDAAEAEAIYGAG